MIRLLITIGIILFSLRAEALDQPKIIVEKKGNVTNYRIEGNLEPEQNLPCISLADVHNLYTPPDLYTAVKSCVKKANYPNAIDLFMLAGAYSSYDALRVSDKTAGQGRTVLIMQLFNGFNDQEKAELQNEFLRRKNDSNNPTLCQQIKQIGKPNYFPKYMILHGMKAFTSNPYENALALDFNGQEQWQLILKNYLHCPE